MTSAELRAAISSLGSTQRGFAHKIGVDPRNVERWCAENGPVVPEPVARIARASLIDSSVLDRIAAAA